MAKSHYPTGYSFIKKKKKPSARLPFFAALLTLLLIPLAASPYFAERFWLADLLSHFAVYYLLAASMCFCLLLVSRRRAFALLALLLAGAQLYQISTTWDFEGLTANRTIPAAQEFGTDTLSVVVHNIFVHNDHKQELVDSLLKRQQDTDMIVLLEVTPEWLSYLEALRKPYVYNSIKPRDDAFGYAVFSKVPTTSITGVKLKNGYEIPVIGAYTTNKLVPFTLYAAHSPPPLSERLWKQRNAYLEQLAELVQTNKNPNRLVVGDFNLTSYSPWFRRFQQQAGLSQPQRSLASLGTWPAVLPAPLRLPIDHMFSSDGITSSLVTLGTFGSDHTMQLANYTLPIRALKPLDETTKPEPSLTAPAVLLQNPEPQGPLPLRQLRPEQRPVVEDNATAQPDLESEMPATGLPSLHLRPPAAAPALPETATAQSGTLPAQRVLPLRKLHAAAQDPGWGSMDRTSADTVEYQDDLERRIAGTR